jgi:hypothetical protein
MTVVLPYSVNSRVMGFALRQCADPGRERQRPTEIVEPEDAS